MTEGVGSAHDLNRTSVWTVLEQRFFARALAEPTVNMEHGWTDQPIAGLFEGLVKDWSVSRCKALPGFQGWLAEGDGVSLLIEVEGDGDWRARACGQAAAVDDVLSKITRLVPQTEPSDENVPVRFWAMGPMGPISYQRRLDVAAWKAVAGNYARPVRGQVEQLMNMTTGPERGGRLSLWSGPPGTGKTHAIRALASTWQSWCDVDYIVDADEFFGHASYMTNVVMGDEGAGRWRLVVIEDAGEYLRQDAFDKTGQGLSRLLNLSDGLPGQGLRLMMLMTTNEDLGDLHGAVTRPGRCMSNVVFGSLTAPEANRWLKLQGSEERVLRSATLAELYARL
jgi:hypothetical protein